jgi:hypothetical protein
MGRTTALRHQIKQAFIPYLAAKGFSVDMRDAPQFFTFRQITAHAVNVCDIQWEKHGRPRFVVNFGKCGAHGVVLRGQRILPDDITSYHGIVRGRLHPGSRRTTRGWFRQDRPLLERIASWSQFYAPQEVVAKLIALFGEVEEFWNSGQVGPHIQLMTRSAKIEPTNFGDKHASFGRMVERSETRQGGVIWDAADGFR